MNQIFNAVMEVSDDEFTLFPPKPIEPREEDCCGSGCTPCVFDLYEQECKIWERKCQILKGLIDLEAPTTSVPTIESYTSFTLLEIDEIIPNVYLLKFSIPSTEICISIGIGQHLVMKCCKDSEVITRQYTPIYSCKTFFEVMIKIYKEGKMSSYIRNFDKGITVDFRGPFGEFKYSQNQFKKIIMLAAGTGIAPMMRIIAKITSDDEEETFLRLIFSCQTYDEIILKQKIDKYKEFWNFTVLYVLTQEKDRNKKKYGDTLSYSRIDSNLLTNELKNIDISKTLCLVCGTRSFNNDMIEFVQNFGIPVENLYKF